MIALGDEYDRFYLYWYIVDFFIDAVPLFYDHETQIKYEAQINQLAPVCQRAGSKSEVVVPYSSQGFRAQIVNNLLCIRALGCLC